MIVKKRPLRKISWGAIFAGVIVSLVVQLILSLLGLAIGLGSINPMTQQDPFAGIGTPALVWWVASMLIALFVGGLAAGRLSGLVVAFDRVLHGFLTFSVYSIVSFFLITTAVGGIISGVGSVVGKTLSYTGQDREVRSQASRIADEFQQRAGAGALQDSIRANEPQIRRTGQDVAETASKVSLFAFFGLVLGAAAASAGSGVGRPKKESEVEYDDSDIAEREARDDDEYDVNRRRTVSDRELMDMELRERERRERERERAFRNRNTPDRDVDRDIRNRDNPDRDIRDRDIRDRDIRDRNRDDYIDPEDRV